MGCETGLRYSVEGVPSLASSAPVPQERLEAARQALSEARKQSSALAEQVQTMRGEMADLELQRAEAEGQLQQLREVRARGTPPVARMLRPQDEVGTSPPTLPSSQTQAQSPGRRNPHNPQAQG